MVMIERIVVPWYLSASELLKPSTRLILTKNVSALGTCLPLVALARIYESHTTTPQGKMLHESSLAHQLVGTN